MIEVIAIGGSPASGKSSLMMRVIAALSKRSMPATFNIGLLHGITFSTSRVIVLGIYDDEAVELFPGTDRLSFAAQPEAVRWLESTHTRPDFDGVRVIFEGDRFFNSKLFASLEALGIPFKIYLLECSPDEQLRRFSTRGSEQQPAFVKGRATKSLSIAQRFPHTVLVNEKLGDLDAWASVILQGITATD